jgi:DNA replication protein DnaC
VCSRCRSGLRFTGSMGSSTFATAHEWVLRLSEAKRAGKLESELERLGRIPLLVID